MISLYSILVLRSKGPRIYSNSLQSLYSCFCRFSILSFKSRGYLRTNAMMLEDDEAERVGATLVSSCELLLGSTV